MVDGFGPAWDLRKPKPPWAAKAGAFRLQAKPGRNITRITSHSDSECLPVSPRNDTYSLCALLVPFSLPLSSAYLHRTHMGGPRDPHTKRLALSNDLHGSRSYGTICLLAGQPGGRCSQRFEILLILCRDSKKESRVELEKCEAKKWIEKRRCGCGLRDKQKR